MKEITIVHKETITQEDGRTTVYNEWLYDNLPIHIAMWFEDHMVKAKNLELNIYDEIPKPEEGQYFACPVGRFVIHSDNGYWIDRVVRYEKQEYTGLYHGEQNPVEVTSFTLKLDNKAINCIGITEPVFHEDGRELWKRAIPLLQYIKEKEDEQTDL